MDTLISHIHQHARQRPDSIAIRQKRYGIWEPTTWADLFENIKALALGLVELGLEPKSKMLIIGDNCMEWALIEFATIAARSVCVGAYQDMLTNEVTYMLSASGARFVAAGDQEQVDKFLAIWDTISQQIDRIIVWDIRGMGDYLDQYPFLITFAEVLERGRKILASDPDRFGRELLDHTSASETVLMLPTSGTTGLPKMAELTHDNFIFLAHAWEKIHPSRFDDEVYSFLPMAWIGEQVNTMRFVCTGFRYNFAESSDPLAVRRDMNQLQCTILGMSSRMWEDICSTIMARMEDAPFLKKKTYQLAMTLGLEKAEQVLEGKHGRLSVLKEILYRVLFSTTLRGVRQRMGLARVGLALTGGAAIGREVFTFFTALGINLVQGYGMTECTGFATIHRMNDIRPETVGKPLPGVKVRIDDNGMIWLRGRGNFQCYYSNLQETADTLEDGWLKTGDAGYWDKAGHLVVLDRQKDLMFLNDGTRFAPQDLENRLKFSPFIRDAVVIGNKRDFIVVLISIDMENTGNWARNRNLAYTTFTDLTQNPKIYQLIRTEVEKINKRLPERMRIVRFALLPKELHPDDEELTRTRKVRRKVINQRYAELIAALFAELEFYHLRLEIRYMDGRISKLENDVWLEDMRIS